MLLKTSRHLAEDQSATGHYCKKREGDNRHISESLTSMMMAKMMLFDDDDYVEDAEMALTIFI